MFFTKKDKEKIDDIIKNIELIKEVSDDNFTQVQTKWALFLYYVIKIKEEVEKLEERLNMLEAYLGEARE